MADFKIFINFKTYKEGTGREAVKLAKILRQAQDKFASEVEVIPIVRQSIYTG